MVPATYSSLIFTNGSTYEAVNEPAHKSAIQPERDPSLDRKVADVKSNSIDNQSSWLPKRVLLPNTNWFLEHDKKSWIPYKLSYNYQYLFNDPKALEERQNVDNQKKVIQVAVAVGALVATQLISYAL